MPRRTYMKYGAGFVTCLVLGYFVFIRGTRVPLLGGADLGFHELGHMLTYWMPDIVTAMMGSIVQVAVPVGLVGYFWFRREYVGVGVCLAWAGASAWDVSIYIADAPYQQLQLIGGEHDWAFVLGEWDAISGAAGIASAVKMLGAALVLTGAVVCAAGPRLEERDGARRAAQAPAAARASATHPSLSDGGWAVVPPWEQEAGAR